MWESLRATLYHNRRDVIMFAIVIIVATALYFPMMTYWQDMGDYPVHNQLAIQVLEEPQVFFANTPHFIYHISTAFIFSLPRIESINFAAVLSMTFYFLVSLGIIYWQLRKRTNLPPTVTVIALSGVLALCLSFMMPITFFTPENLYFGYFVPHVYHNPTVVVMKSFSLLLFFMSLSLFFNDKPKSAWWIIPFSITTILSLLAKPSFMIAFVPALGLLTASLMLWRMSDIMAILRQPLSIFRAFFYRDLESTQSLPRMLQASYINWTVLIFGIVLPTFIVLYIQTLTWTSSGGIGIEPFRVLLEWSIHYDENANKQILLKFIMSSAFPLIVYLLHIRKASKNFMFNLAWLLYLVSAAYYYFFVDYTIIAAGDFTWSSQIAVLILYIVSSIFMMKHYGSVLTGERQSLFNWSSLIVCTAIFSLHVVAGINWYNLHLNRLVEELVYRWW